MLQKLNSTIRNFEFEMLLQNFINLITAQNVSPRFEFLLKNYLKEAIPVTGLGGLGGL
jgi:hypothetical protein